MKEEYEIHFLIYGKWEPTQDGFDTIKEAYDAMLVWIKVYHRDPVRGYRVQMKGRIE